MKMKISIIICIVGIIIVSESIAAPGKGKMKGRRGRNMERRISFSIKRICKRDKFQLTSLCKAFKACKDVDAGVGIKWECYNDQCTKNQLTYSDFFCEGIKCKLNSMNNTEIPQNRTTARECVFELCKSNCMNGILDALESKLCRMMMANKCRKDFNGRNNRKERRSCIEDAKCVIADQTDDEVGVAGDDSNS